MTRKINQDQESSREADDLLENSRYGGNLKGQGKFNRESCKLRTNPERGSGKCMSGRERSIFKERRNNQRENTELLGPSTQQNH